MDGISHGPRSDSLPRQGGKTWVSRIAWGCGGTVAAFLVWILLVGAPNGGLAYFTHGQFIGSPFWAIVTIGPFMALAGFAGGVLACRTRFQTRLSRACGGAILGTAAAALIAIPLGVVLGRVGGPLFIFLLPFGVLGGVHAGIHSTLIAGRKVVPLVWALTAGLAVLAGEALTSSNWPHQDIIRNLPPEKIVLGAGLLAMVAAASAAVASALVKRSFGSQPPARSDWGEALFWAFLVALLIVFFSGALLVFVTVMFAY